jgi:hypothetical protein
LAFFISNLVVIPAAWCIMMLGFISVLISSFGLFIPPDWHPLHYLLEIMNGSVKMVESMQTLVDQLSIKRFELVLFYIILFFGFKGIFETRRAFLFISGTLTILLISGFILENHQLNKTKGLTIYSISNQKALLFRKGRSAVLAADSSLLNNSSKMKFHVMHDVWAKNIQELNIIPLECEEYESLFLRYRNGILFFEDHLISFNPDTNYSEQWASIIIQEDSIHFLRNSNPSIEHDLSKFAFELNYSNE